jgi:molybdopterin molybdotransferase
MIEFHEAFDRIVSNAVPSSLETVDLTRANKRVLAEDVYYDMDIPPFDKSAMDGFACRKKDLGNELTIIETVYAGKEPAQQIGENECAKIMTGAVVPPGADMIFIKEVAELTGEDKVVCKKPEIQENICYTGEDVRKGELALPKGSLITSKNIPVLAGAGANRFKVYRQPVVAVFSTGTELVEPGSKTLPFQIRNSNSYQMLAQLGDMGIEAEYRGIIKDDEVETEEKIAAAMKTSDLILFGFHSRDHKQTGI